jgi:hypothetical protein
VYNKMPRPYRLGGDSRYQTMNKIVGMMWMNWGMGTQYVSIAVGTNFPDALAGAAVTGGWEGVLLLTPKDALGKDAAGHISRVGGQLQWVDVYGGKSSVWPAVVQDVYDAL